MIDRVFYCPANNQLYLVTSMNEPFEFCNFIYCDGDIFYMTDEQIDLKFEYIGEL